MGKIIDDSLINRLKYQVDCVKFIEDIIAPHCTPQMQLKDFHKEWIELFNKNRFVSLLAPRSHGKALALDSKVLTPTGWKLMKDIQIGDYAIGFDGKPTKVIGVYPQGKMDVYKITTSDGRVCRCSKDHLWTIQTPSNTKNRFVTKTLEEIEKNYKSDRKDGCVEYRHFIPTCKPIEFKEKQYLIEPYTFGAWLGDGDSTGDGITTNDTEILGYLQYRNVKRTTPYRYGLYGLKTDIKKLGLYKNKHIPEEYLFGSVEQRTRLLQGLLDTDGNNQTDGHVFEFNNTNFNIIQGIIALIRSLGGTAKYNYRETTCMYKGVEIHCHSYRVTGKVPNEIIPFRLTRKVKNWKRSLKTRSSIVGISLDGQEEVQCIKVDNEDGLFITDDYLVTHNTQLVGAYIIWNIVKNPNIRILVVTINQEMADNIMSFIQRHLEGNDTLIEMFGQQRGHSDWSRSTLRVLGSGNQKDPTLKVLGITASMVGGHHNMIILDDIMDANNSKTEHRRKDVISLFESTMMPMLEPNGKVISIATRWHEADVSAYLQKIPDYASRVYKAVIKYPEDTGGDAEVLWPERFPYEELMKIKDRYGSLAFEMQYQNNIVSIADAPIKREWVEASIDNYKPISGSFETYMGVDLSSKGEETDFFAITIIGIAEGKIWVLDSLRTKASLFRQFELIRSYDSKWQPIRIGIDQAAQQKMIVDQLIESTTLPIIPVKPSIVNDKMSRAQRLSVLFETGRIYLNPELQQLSDELCVFPHGSNDDMMDSLSFAVQAGQYTEEETHVDWNEVAEIVSDIKKEKSVRSVDRYRIYTT